MSVSSEGRRRRQVLTTRQKMIIQILVRMASEPVTVSAISEKLNVSSRTILREMPAVESWFRDNDFRFIRKPGVGLMIEENSDQLMLIRELLDMEDVIPVFSRQERRRHLLGELLSNTEPVKAYVYTSRYHVSEGTLYGDLDALGRWLSDYQVKISRRPGVGLYMECRESAYRQAAANAVFEFMEEDQLFALINEEISKDDSERRDDKLIHFLEPKAIRLVRMLLSEAESQLNIQYTDSGYMNLVVHLTLALSRMQAGRVVERMEERGRLKQTSEYEVASRMAVEMEKHFLVDVPESEIDFIAMHLTSARIWPCGTSSRGQRKVMSDRQIVMSMAGVVEQLIGLPFRSCSDMIDDLVTHMHAMMSRLAMNLRIENSQTESIRQNYPEIYQAVETSCEVLKEMFAMSEMPEAEVGYIAMHFAAAAEKLQETEQRIVVVVVCPTGMGTSKMLAANVRRSFHNIEIRKIISAFGISPEELRRDGVDLILSTVVLNTDFPHLCVSPILQEQDKLLLQNTIEAIHRRRIRRKSRNYYRTPVPDLESIVRISRIGLEIAEIIYTFRIGRKECAVDVRELIQQAAALFADTDEKKHEIARAIEAREKLADTFISEMGVYLLHCRTAAVTSDRFGYLCLETPMQTEKGEARGAVVMLIPDNDATVHAEVLSSLSVLLVEKADFLQALCSGDQMSASAMAKEALIRYYQAETGKQLGITER